MAPTAAAPAQIDGKKLEEFVGKVVGDFGAAPSSMLTYMGQKLGLYTALRDAGSVTSEELAKRTGLSERYLREWLLNQASGGYVGYDPATGRYHLPAEQAVALTDETSPFFVGGGFYVIKAMVQAEPRITEAFRKGGGMFWGEHDPDLFIGTERFFRPGYATHLTAEWIPSLTGIEQKLKVGAKVADVGCGRGASTLIMAQTYPKSRFWGFDNHEGSIEHARKQAAKAGVSDRVTFEVVEAAHIPPKGYDLICFFDCLHDMGRPAEACRRAYEALAPDGSVLLVEPMAGDRVEDNFNPIGRTFSGASTLCCTPNAMAHGGQALGAVATEQALAETLKAGGFTQFRRATETPFNRIFEARR